MRGDTYVTGLGIASLVSALVSTNAALQSESVKRAYHLALPVLGRRHLGDFGYRVAP